tara:strand:+ start:2777 stop:3964 length:1188 start_codon:yes stop_codon:yes gene_type:complete
MNKINLILLLYINSVLSFNLYSIIYPIKHSFRNIDKKWNYVNRLFPTNKKSTYIGKWNYYNNIDLIKDEKNVINNPEYWTQKTILTMYKYDSDKIIISKIFNDSNNILNHYIKKRVYDNNKEYYRKEYYNSNRISNLNNTQLYTLLNKEANILRTLVIRPNSCSVTCTPYIPKMELVNKLINKKNLNNTKYSINFNIWLTDRYIYNNSQRIGLFISYDGINGNLKELILKKEHIINDNIEINDKIDINYIYNSDNIIKFNITDEKTNNIKEFDNNTSINYIILKNNWIGDYRIQNIYDNDNQISWGSEHNYFIPISNNEIDKYYELKFKDGIYANIPKNLNDFRDDDNIYIEFVCFFNNGSGIQRFIAWGSKSIGGIKTYCHDIWQNKLPVYYLD